MGNIQFLLMMMMMMVHGIYPQACIFLKLRHHHTHLLTQSLILLRKKYHYRTNYSIHKKKIDRTEMFDDYFPCQKDNCTLEYVRNWFNLFVDVYNSMIIFAK